jgi:ubiquinone/menaquinone biosynthesis C-methylase UbiE
MKTQKEIFKATEGDQWFFRNKESYEHIKNENDVIVQSLKEIGIIPKQVLEIGCSNGTKLNNLNKVFGSECFGIDPSVMAIKKGKKEYPRITLRVGTADLLPFNDNKFDMIIFGFCLYLCDRKDLFKIAFEADRCLSDNGFLVIMDFYPPFPYKNIYKHKEGLYSYKMNYAKLFSWNPVYNEIFNMIFGHSEFSKRNTPDERVAVTILNKSEEFAYPIFLERIRKKQAKTMTFEKKHCEGK